MLLLNKERFLKLPAGVLYIEVNNDDGEPATAMMINPIKVKGNSLEDFDCQEGCLSFAPTSGINNGVEDWPCIGHVYDEDKGFSESMDLDLTMTRGGLIGEHDVKFIVFEPKDISTMQGWLGKAFDVMSAWLKEQPAEYPELMNAVKNTSDDEDFK